MDETILCAIRLSKAGYGSVDHILNSSADIICKIMDYEGFLSKYEEAFIDINRGD